MEGEDDLCTGRESADSAVISVSCSGSHSRLGRLRACETRVIQVNVVSLVLISCREVLTGRNQTTASRKLAADSSLATQTESRARLAASATNRLSRLESQSTSSLLRQRAMPRVSASACTA